MIIGFYYQFAFVGQGNIMLSFVLAEVIGKKVEGEGRGGEEKVGEKKLEP